MENRFAGFVFKYRKFITITAYLLSIGLKVYLQGTTSMQLLILGLVFVALGMSIRSISAAYMLGKHIVTEVGADYLCALGPYAYVRNPLYVGNVLVGVGASIALNEWYGYAIILLTNIIMYSIIIPYEETFLIEKFGDVFTTYQKHVKRFIPRLKAYESDAKVAFNLKLALLSEKYYIIILIIAFLSIYFLFIK